MRVRPGQARGSELTLCRGGWLLGGARRRGRATSQTRGSQRGSPAPQRTSRTSRLVVNTGGKGSWHEVGRARGAAQHLTTRTKRGEPPPPRTMLIRPNALAGQAGRPEAPSRRAALRGEGPPSTSILKAELGRCNAQGSRAQSPEGPVAGRLGTTPHSHVSPRRSAPAGETTLLPAAPAAQAHRAPPTRQAPSWPREPWSRRPPFPTLLLTDLREPDSLYENVPRIETGKLRLTHRAKTGGS